MPTGLENSHCLLPPILRTWCRSAVLHRSSCIAWSIVMNPLRRQFLQLTAGAVAAPVVARRAFAEAYPSRPVRLVCGFAPAGGNDIIARLIGQWLTERLGQTFVVENRPGAATNIAAELVIKSPPDGYTLFVTNLSNAVNVFLYKSLNFDFMRDMLPVAGIAQAPSAFAINSSVPAKTVTEFIAYAKANPGKSTWFRAATEPPCTCPASCSR